MDAFDDYMLKHVRALKVLRDQYRSAPSFALPDLPDEDRDAVTGDWPREFDRILNGESASMIAEDARNGRL